MMTPREFNRAADELADAFGEACDRIVELESQLEDAHSRISELEDALEEAGER